MKTVKLIIATLLTAGCSLTANAEEIAITKVKYAGPYEVKTPFIADSTDVNSKKFDAKSLLDADLNLDLLNDGKDVYLSELKGNGTTTAINLIGFNISNSAYTDATIEIKQLSNYQLFVDGKKMMSGYVKLEPSSHQIVIKYLTEGPMENQPELSISCGKDGVVSMVDASKKHYYNMMDVLHAKRVNLADLSPNGKMLITNYYTTNSAGKTTQKARITDLTSGKTIADRASGIHWMPRGNKYYFTREALSGRELVTVDPLTGEETILAEKLPAGRLTISPTEDFLILDVTEEGPKEDANVYEVIEPDDRQPGWRSRNNLSLYDLKTKMAQPLTYGHHNISLADISNDGKYILFMKSESRLTARPTTVFSIYKMNLETMQTSLIVDKDGFVDNAIFSPDGKDILVSGSPEALDGIGKKVKEGQIPSMAEKELYLISNGKTIPLTKDFDPCVSKYKWNKADGMIYLTAEDKDSVNLFQINPKDFSIKEIACNEEMITGFSLSSDVPMMAYYGQGASNSDRVYTLNLKNLKSTLQEDLSKETLQNVTLGECKAWTFKNSKGETIYGRYYLPADFSPEKKYPMIVNYYGGCSPTSRNFESRYPHHAYAALGYVVLIINPSGATGFGQEFSARHVNTAGEGVAQDIIEGTKQFCKEHSYINDKKIGCIGASYGGFMTQYLQTVTDIFAAAISHAGISDHTSYWGEGYWGYSYSEVSMANSYPWTDKHLYVDQSPLFNAEKIHTPLLFLHGDADTNVPVGESIQMYTALKLLGRETAMVLVKGENHHILEYQKRLKWQNTIFAWFAKYKCQMQYFCDLYATNS